MNEEPPVKKYTPEEKNRLEIEKLDEEIKDLRSKIRRWVGGVGTTVGVVGTGLRIFLAIKSNSDATEQRDYPLNQKTLEEIQTLLAKSNSAAAETQARS